jgi:dTMP kinase
VWKINTGREAGRASSRAGHGSGGLPGAGWTPHTTELIRPALEAGKWVVSDRYADASFAYQGYGRNLGGELVRRLNELATGGLVPDLAIVLDLPPEEAAQRSPGAGWKADRLERERADFHRRVREGYLQLAKEEPERVKILDGRGTVEEIQEQIRAIVDPLIEKKSLMTGKS